MYSRSGSPREEIYLQDERLFDDRQLGTYWWLMEATTLAVVRAGVDLHNTDFVDSNVHELVERQFWLLNTVAHLFSLPTSFLEIGLLAGNDLAKGKKVRLTYRPRRSHGDTGKVSWLLEQVLDANKGNGAFDRMIRDRKLLAVALAWTSFESLCTDLWDLLFEQHGSRIAAQLVNSSSHATHQGSPPTTSHSLLKRLDAGGSSAKHLYRRFAFLLGDNSPVFSSLPHWIAAYLTEKTRHIVLHRGGRADEKYIRETGVPLSPGMLIDMNNETVYSSVRYLGELGVRLAVDVDRWLRSGQ
jgi:hypothetical protein